MSVMSEIKTFINIFELTRRRNEHTEARKVVSFTIIGTVSSRKHQTIFIFLDELAAVEQCLKKSIILMREGGLLLSRQITDTCLGSAFLDSFKCLVCHSLLRSPATMLGCSTCIDQWFAENSRCLHCRTENAQERKIRLICFSKSLSQGLFDS